jgi:hypothetical protein
MTLSKMSLQKKKYIEDQVPKEATKVKAPKSDKKVNPRTTLHHLALRHLSIETC